MTPEIDALYPSIGHQLNRLIDGPFSIAWVRVEMEDDFGSVGVFVDRGRGTYEYLIDPEGSLYELFSELRRRHKEGGLGSWTQATFRLEGHGGFSIQFGFDDVTDLGQSGQRREAWMERELGPRAEVVWPEP
jgi:hypothetical protein